MTREEAMQAIEQIREAAIRRGLSDKSLAERGCTTRKDVGIGGEYLYGIFMVPEEMVLEIVDVLMGEEA